MRRVVLVKHSLPVLSARMDSAEWELSPEGVRRCGPLAEALARYVPAALYCSVEGKAAHTARLVGERLGLDPVVTPGLHEHDRRGTPLLASEAFEAAMARFFARPTERVYGNESAAEALARFGGALDGIMACEPHGNVIVVTHGTVISLYVASRNGAAAFDLWRRLECPGVVVLVLPKMRVEHIVEHIV